MRSRRPGETRLSSLLLSVQRKVPNVKSRLQQLAHRVHAAGICVADSMVSRATRSHDVARITQNKIVRTHSPIRNSWDLHSYEYSGSSTTTTGHYLVPACIQTWGPHDVRHPALYFPHARSVQRHWYVSRSALIADTVSCIVISQKMMTTVEIVWICEFNVHAVRHSIPYKRIDVQPVSNRGFPQFKNLTKNLTKRRNFDLLQLCPVLGGRVYYGDSLLTGVI